MLKWLAAGAAAVLLIGLLRTKKAADNLSIDVINAKFGYQPPLRGRLTLSLLVKNASRESLTLTQPFVRAFYNGTEIGSSTPSAAVITINPTSETTFPVDLTTSNAGILQAVAGILAAGKQVMRIQLTVQTIANNLPVEEAYDVDLPITI